MDLLSDEFKKRAAGLLQSRMPVSIDRHLVPAAVLMPFFEKDGKIHLLFTKRAGQVARHKRQVSFPGGVKESCDMTLLDTALRESAEEVGLDPGGVEILGVLDDVPTVATDYVITPYVGFLDRAPSITLCREEVDCVFDVGLDTLLESGALHDVCIEEEGVPRKVMAYKYDGHVIWGATARIVRQFTDMLGSWPVSVSR